MPISTRLTTSNGQLFIGGRDALYASKEFDGTTVWQYDFSGLSFPSVNPPAVANVSFMLRLASNSRHICSRSTPPMGARYSSRR